MGKALNMCFMTLVTLKYYANRIQRHGQRTFIAHPNADQFVAHIFSIFDPQDLPYPLKLTLTVWNWKDQIVSWFSWSGRIDWRWKLWRYLPVTLLLKASSAYHFAGSLFSQPITCLSKYRTTAVRTQRQLAYASIIIKKALEISVSRWATAELKPKKWKSQKVKADQYEQLGFHRVIITWVGKLHRLFWKYQRLHLNLVGNNAPTKN